jgi:hypothetical protein
MVFPPGKPRRAFKNTLSRLDLLFVRFKKGCFLQTLAHSLASSGGRACTRHNAGLPPPAGDLPLCGMKCYRIEGKGDRPKPPDIDSSLSEKCLKYLESVAFVVVPAAKLIDRSVAQIVVRCDFLI